MFFCSNPTKHSTYLEPWNSAIDISEQHKIDEFCEALQLRKVSGQDILYFFLAAFSVYGY